MKIKGYTAKGFSEEVGISISTVWNWKEMPGWVKAYLKLRQENDDLRDQVRALKLVLKERL